MESKKGGWIPSMRATVLWVLIAFEVLGLGLAGYAKFSAADRWIAQFAEWGYPGWFRSMVGGAELGGALLLLVPKVSSYAATLLLVIVVGALVTVLTRESQFGPIAPLIHAISLAIILAWRWDQRWQPGS